MRMGIGSVERRVLAAGIGLFLGVLAMPLFGEEYRIICEREGSGPSVVEVLQATGVEFP